MEKRSFDQKYKFSVKNDMVCIWTNFKNIMGAYDFNIVGVLSVNNIFLAPAIVTNSTKMSTNYGC